MLDGAIIPLTMRTFSSKRVKLSSLVLAVALVFIFSWASLTSVGAEPASSGQERFEVVSPGPVVTFEGKLQRPW